MRPKRTIDTILSLETAQIIEADEFFADQKSREHEIFILRTQMQQKIEEGNVEHVCLYCKHPVVIRGHRERADRSAHFFFMHMYDSEDCIIKTNRKLTKDEILRFKFNGQKEGALHNSLKLSLASYLETTVGVTSVAIEKVYKNEHVSGEWKKPDILATYAGKEIAFELQLSTTFISVIVSRTLFYRNAGVSLLWIFASFSIDSDQQKFTQKDVYHNNNFNVFVFDLEAIAQSKLNGQLVLKCFYKDYVRVFDTVRDVWKNAFISKT